MKEKLKIKGTPESLVGTLKWWESLEKKTYIENVNVPILFLELNNKERQFLAEITHNSDSRCREDKGCNITYITGSPCHEQVLFTFPLSKKCYEAVNNYVTEVIDQFIEWWEEA